MAGIGLRLHRLASGGTYWQGATAYASSAVIVAGPWLVALCALLALNGASGGWLDEPGRVLLFTTLTYAFGASSIATGGLQLVVTRYLADRFYERRTAGLAAVCAGVLALALPLAALATPFALFAPFALPYRLVVASLFVTLALIWLLTIFLSAARDYARIVLIFGLGYGASAAAAVAGGRAYGAVGALGGFAAGQVVCLACLAAHIGREFAPAAGLDLTFLRHARRFPELFAIGLCYNATLWIDNGIYWATGHATTVAGFYRIYPAYDATKMIAFLTTIPAAAVFLVHLETHFYEHYRAFYRFVERKGTLAQIRAARDGMARAARAGIGHLIKLQGAIALALALFAPLLAGPLRLTAAQVPLLRLAALGAGGQFLMLVAVLLLLYLDQRGAALLVVAAHAAGNALGTAATLPLGPAWHGLGFLIASAGAAALALVILRDRLRRLDYLTFARQRMGE